MWRCYNLYFKIFTTSYENLVTQSKFALCFFCFHGQEQRLDAFGDWLEEQELPEELRPRTEA